MALLYLEGLLLITALVHGVFLFPLLGAMLLVAGLAIAFNGARVIGRAALVYRLLALSLAFVVVMSAGWGIDAARIFFALLVLLLSGLTLVATRKVTSMVGTSRTVADAEALDYCLFGDPPRRRIDLRRLFTPRLSRAMPWFAGAIVLVGLGIALSVISDRGLAALFVIPAAFAFHRGRRHMAPPAGDAMRADDRPPTLILRSFQDDRITVERFKLTPRRTFEQLVAGVLKSVGPPIIVGDPGEQLPRLGALRAYFASDDWQTAVTRLMEEAALLVFVLGDTENLFWEFRQAVSEGRKNDALIIVPPLERRVLRSRWERFASENAGSIDDGVPPESPTDVVLGLFFAGDDPIFIASRKRSVIDFQLGIRLFLRLQRERIQSGEELAGFIEVHLPLVRCRS